jgi:hypothetical protein
VKYRVCKMQDGNGDEWFQVQSSRYGFFWRWDCSWPWATKFIGVSDSAAVAYRSPRRFETIDEAREHIAQVKHDDLSKLVKIVDVFSDRPPAVEFADVTHMFAYAATPDLSTPADPVVTETKPAKKKAPKRGSKKTS